MSGIAGFWNRDGRPVDTTLLGRMGASLAHRGRDAEGMTVVGSAGMVCRLARIVPESANEIQPIADAGDLMLVFDGRLDNRDDLLAALQGDAGVSRDAPDSALALAGFRRYGEALPERLLGDFALAVFDTVTQRLLLARDGIGLRPLQYHLADRTVLFASEIKAILADPSVPAEPDEDVVADLLLNRLAAEDSDGLTCFRGIRTVLPGCVLIVTRDRVIRRRYWDFDSGYQVRFRRFEDYVSAFHEHFRRAVQRRMRSRTPVGVSVSGGVDSSAVFCQAHVLRRSHPELPPLIGATFTFPPGSASCEDEFVELIEQRHDVRICRAHDLPGGITRRAREGVWHAETPTLDPQWNRLSAFLSHVRGAGVRILLTGSWGDQVLFDSAYLLELCGRGRWFTAWSQARGLGFWVGAADTAHFRRELLRAVARHTIPEVFVPALRRCRVRLFRGRSVPGYSDAIVSRARLAAATRRPAPRNAFGPLGRSLYSQVRSRYHLHCMEWAGKVGAMHDIEMASPFLDRELVAFLIAVPGDVLVRNGVPKVLLREAMKGILPDEIAWRASKADFTDVTNAGIAGDFDQVIASVGTGSSAARAGYVALQTLGAVARPTVSVQTSTAGRVVTDLFALELWLQEYFSTGKWQAGGRT